MKNYKIQKFRTVRVSKNTLLLYGRRGAHRIVSLSLFEKLKELSVQCGHRVSEEYLDRLFSDYEQPFWELKSYLESDLQILKEYEKRPPITRVALFTESEFLSEMFLNHYTEKSIFDIQVYSRPEKVDRDTLIVSFQEGYDPRWIKEIYSKNKELDVPILTSYLFERYFVVDSLYIHSEFLPCHFCNFMNIGDQYRIEERGANLDFVRLYEQMLKENSVRLPAFKISNLERCKIIVFLYSKIAGTLQFDEPVSGAEDRYSIYYMTRLDIEMNTTQREIVVHHPLCSCTSRGRMR